MVTLADGRFPPGTHVVPWRGTDITGESVRSGVYFYRLEAGGFSQTKKLLVAR